MVGKKSNLTVASRLGPGKSCSQCGGLLLRSHQAFQALTSGRLHVVQLGLFAMFIRRWTPERWGPHVVELAGQVL